MLLGDTPEEGELRVELSDVLACVGGEVAYGRDLVVGRRLGAEVGVKWDLSRILIVRTVEDVLYEAHVLWL